MDTQSYKPNMLNSYKNIRITQTIMPSILNGRVKWVSAFGLS